MILYKLPCGSYRWVENEEFDLMSNIIMNYEESIKYFTHDSDFSVIISCDIQTPSSQTAQDELDDLPFLIEKIKVGNTTRLVPTLHSKQDYTAHILMIQQAQAHGYVINSC